MPSTSRRAGVDRFLERPRDATCTSVRAGGQPVLAPIWSVWKGGMFIVSTSTITRRWAHLKQDGRCLVLIDREDGVVDATGRAVLRAAWIRIKTRLVVEKQVEEERVDGYLQALRAGPPRSMDLLRPDRLCQWGIER